MTDHDHDKHIATPEFNNSAAENFPARLAQANLARKNDIAALVKKTDFDENITKLAIKTELKVEQNKVKKCEDMIEVLLSVKITLTMKELKII